MGMKEYGMQFQRLIRLEYREKRLYEQLKEAQSRLLQKLINYPPLFSQEESKENTPPLPQVLLQFEKHQQQLQQQEQQQQMIPNEITFQSQSSQFDPVDDLGHQDSQYSSYQVYEYQDYEFQDYDSDSEPQMKKQFKDRAPLSKESMLFGEICVICQSEFEIGDITLDLEVCEHRFHSVCVTPWLKKKCVCPLCRRDLG